MAMIKCPECGNSVSSMAKACIHCGCPLSEVSPTGTVRIKMPNNIVEGLVGLFSSRRAAVVVNGRTVWEGQHGQNANFTVNGPTKVKIELGGWANDIEGTVYPHKKYALVQDMGVHWLATFRLTEVDVIDAD